MELILLVPLWIIIFYIWYKWDKKRTEKKEYKKEHKKNIEKMIEVYKEEKKHIIAKEFNDKVYSVAITPDNKTLLVFFKYKDQYRRVLYDISTNKEIASFDTRDYLDYSVFNKDGDRVLYYGVGYNSADLCKTYSDETIVFLSQFGRLASIYKVLLNKKGNCAVTYSENDTVKIWDCDKIDHNALSSRSAKVKTTIKIQHSYSNSLLKFLNDEKNIFIVEKSKFGIYKLSGEKLATYKNRDGDFSCVAISSDEKYVATLVANNIEIFQITSFELITTIKQEGKVKKILINSNYLAVVFYKEIKFYTTDNFTHIKDSNISFKSLDDNRKLKPQFSQYENTIYI